MNEMTFGPTLFDWLLPIRIFTNFPFLFFLLIHISWRINRYETEILPYEIFLKPKNRRVSKILKMKIYLLVVLE